jgi:hypothetical protein
VAVDSSGNIFVTGSTAGGLPSNTSSGGLDIFLAKFDSSGNLLFIQQFGSNRDDIGHGLAVDSSGNIFVTGSTAGSLPGNTSSGGLDIFLAKFDSSGNLLFIQQFGSNFDDIGYGVALDSSANAFITGSTEGLLGTSAFGFVDVFLAKFDSSGNLLFIQQFGSNFDDIGYGVALDSSANAFITGSTKGLLGTSAFGFADVFLAKFDSSGNLLFIQQFGSNRDDIGHGLAVDSSGNIFVTGSTAGSLPGNTSSGGLDIFLAKLDTSGNSLFIQQFGSNFDDIGYGVALDTSGNVFITGSTGGSLPGIISSGGLDIFLAKLDNSGNSLFIQQFGSNFDDIGYGVALDSSSNAFITGSTEGLLGTSAFGFADVFLAKFNSSGVKQ